MNLDDILDAIDQLFDRTPIKIIVTTLGSKGAIISTREHRWEIPVFSVGGVLDTTGAGDAFSAGFLVGFCENRPLDECGRMGAATAALLIQKVGAREGLPSRVQLEEVLGKN